MHRLRLTLDDTTYQQIMKDAEIRDLTITEWITRAFSSFIHHDDPVRKEVFVKEGDRNVCEISPLNVEFLHPPGSVGPNGNEPGIAEINRLKAEIDHLKALLYERGDPTRCITEDQADLIRLNGEIEKASIELDEMEAGYERMRMECERLTAENADRDAVCKAQAGLERQGYEINDFRKEIDLLFRKRDELEAWIEKQNSFKKD
ncbi:MAG TPA: hypothetical protein VMC42_06690 [Methanoregulaceae archaeon]|nr:hypothetical protein [Methanoregulaceae archaeon]